MRAITKQGTGGPHLTRSHARPPQTSRQAISRWRNFSHKAEIQRQLLVEQYHLCCYSELRADEEKFGYHIEHVENKSQNPKRTFDYTNLAASAIQSGPGLSTFRAHDRTLFGGHAAGKQSAVDLTRFVSCHQRDCQRFFAYLSDGRVTPAFGLSESDSEKAKYTISLLNLNSPFLMTLRMNWWSELDQFFQEHLNRDWNLTDLARIDLVPSAQKLSRFFSLTRQFYGAVAEHVLRCHAPELV